jgi:hypothetical protein
MYDELKGLVYLTGIAFILMVVTGAHLNRALEKLGRCLKQTTKAQTD